MNKVHSTRIDTDRNAHVQKLSAPTGLVGRVLLGELIRGGIEPPPQLVRGALYEARLHSITGEPGIGKTLLALYLSVQMMRSGLRVLYLDAENGENLVAARLQDMGAADIVDDLFFSTTLLTSVPVSPLLRRP